MFVAEFKKNIGGGAGAATRNYFFPDTIQSILYKISLFCINVSNGFVTKKNEFHVMFSYHDRHEITKIQMNFADKTTSNVTKD